MTDCTVLTHGVRKWHGDAAPCAPPAWCLCERNDDKETHLMMTHDIFHLSAEEFQQVQMLTSEGW